MVAPEVLFRIRTLAPIIGTPELSLTFPLISVCENITNMLNTHNNVKIVFFIFLELVNYNSNL